jgi:hypothetical protein
MHYKYAFYDHLESSVRAAAGGDVAELNGRWKMVAFLI